MPGADSGTFDYFTEVVNGEVDASTTIATQSEDDNVLVTGVAGDVNAIGYFGYAYYVENKDKLKAVEIDGGNGCVAPTDDDDRRQHLLAAQPAAVHLPEHRQGQGVAALNAFVDFYLAKPRHLRGRSRLRGGPGRRRRRAGGRLDGRRPAVIAASRRTGRLGRPVRRPRP